MKHTALIALNVVLIALIVGLALFWEPAVDQAPLPGTQAARMGGNVVAASVGEATVALPLARAPQGGDFSFDGLHGPVALHDFSGKLVLLYFGYTYCPDICPTSLMVWQQALGQLSPAEQARVQPIFVSVDPERDTLARLEEYAHFFHPSIIGLTATPERIKEVADRYGAVFVRQEAASAAGYVIDHSAMTYVIDARGQLVDSLPHGAPVEQLLASLRTHLSSP